MSGRWAAVEQVAPREKVLGAVAVVEDLVAASSWDDWDRARLFALSAHLSADAFNAYRKRLAEWLTKAHRLRDQLILALRESLSSEQNDEAARPAAKRGHAPPAGVAGS